MQPKEPKVHEQVVYLDEFRQDRRVVSEPARRGPVTVVNRATGKAVFHVCGPITPEPDLV